MLRGKWKLHALAPDGSRGEELPLEQTGESLRLNLDTSALPGGATVFFELVKEDSAS